MKESILVNWDEIFNESEYCKHCKEQEYNDCLGVKDSMKDSMMLYH